MVAEVRSAPVRDDEASPAADGAPLPRCTAPHRPEDGSITQFVIGNAQSINVPGRGRVWFNTGVSVFEITFDGAGNPQFEFILEHGQHSEADQLEVLCELLGP
jgi:hypothetical protein